MSAEYWVNRWDNNDAPWHKTSRYHFLVNHEDKLLNNRDGIKLFFPLCGKSVDMKHYYDAGHTIVGVDVAKKAIEEFFAESNIEFTVKPVENYQADLYQSLDGRLSLYLMDFFDFNVNIGGQFDGIWDRGALVAINAEDRERYRDLMLTLVGDETRYLVAINDYDGTQFTGPPRCVPFSTVQELYGEACSVELIETVDNMDDKSRNRGMTRHTKSLILIKKNTQEKDDDS